MSSDLSAATAKLSVSDAPAASDPSPSTAAPSDPSTSSSTPAAGDADEAQQSHPLEHTWTFHFNPPNKPSASGEWSSNVKEVSSFATVEDFWRLYNALKPPSQLQTGSNYHLFKQGIQPEWEDPANRRGGKWTIVFPRRGGDAVAVKTADDAWLYTQLAMIGEQFGADSDEICGAVIAPRNKETRLALWTRTGDDEDTVRRIGSFFKKNLSHEAIISYQLHDESIKKQTSYRVDAAFRV